MKNSTRGYMLIELVVAVGLFAMVMTLASGAYLVMIDINRQTQSISVGISNLSFALETMARTIRTGTDYGCPTTGTNCSGGTSFSFTNASGAATSYTLSSGVIEQNGVALTDPSVTVSSLLFYLSGAGSTAAGDYEQARVTIVVSGTVPSGSGGKTESFTVETGATMRGTDI